MIWKGYADDIKSAVSLVATRSGDRMQLLGLNKMALLPKWLFRVALAVVVLLASAKSFAVVPGSIVDNQASVAFRDRLATSLEDESNIVETIVQELTDVSITVQGDAEQDVASPQSVTLEFALQHLGNGFDEYQITLESTGEFALENPELWLDANNSGSFEPVEDISLDLDGFLALGPEENALLFLFGDVPAGLAIGDQSIVALTATSQDAGDQVGNVGATLVGEGDNDTNLIIGTSGGQQTASVTLTVTNNATIFLEKSLLSVEEPDGGDRPVPGARLRYQIRVIFDGEGELTGITVVDPIPDDTTYLPGSLVVDGVTNTDAVGDDAASFDGSNNQVILQLGDVSAPTADVFFEFQVTIN